jgi:hypothetical protein
VRAAFDVLQGRIVLSADIDHAGRDGRIDVPGFRDFAYASCGEVEEQGAYRVSAAFSSAKYFQAREPCTCLERSSFALSQSQA